MEFFKSKLHNIDGAGDIGDNLLAIIKGKVPTSKASNNTGDSPAVEVKAPKDESVEKVEQDKE